MYNQEDYTGIVNSNKSSNINKIIDGKNFFKNAPKKLWEKHNCDFYMK
jgi:hypothetical protein